MCTLGAIRSVMSRESGDDGKEKESLNSLTCRPQTTSELI